MQNWGDSSFFLMVNDMREKEPEMGKKKRWFTIFLLFFMVIGASIGELPSMANIIPGMKFDMFFFVCIVVGIMAWTNIFPARKYTKFISWDILVTIATAFAISKAMQNSGMADTIGAWAVEASKGHSPYVLLGIVFLICNVFTELMTNNAAAALAFPISISMAEHLGVSPMPFIVVICIAASASFCTPIGYQTNLIVQGVGSYKFSDFVKIGLPLNLIVGIMSVLLIPIFWPF
jgi:di/tricarboxylate transporter